MTNPSPSQAITTFIEKLELLEKAATKGNWFRNVPTGLIRSTEEGKYVGDKVLTISGGWRTLDEYDANIDLCIELRNAAPQLLKALRVAVMALEEVEKQQKAGNCEGEAHYWNCDECGGNKPLEGVLSTISTLLS